VPRMRTVGVAGAAGAARAGMGVGMGAAPIGGGGVMPIGGAGGTGWLQAAWGRASAPARPAVAIAMVERRDKRDEREGVESGPGWAAV
jgi:hypothetical protein